MSGGQIIGGVVGAVTGYFIPGGGATMALRGMSLGMSIGGYLDPPKGPVVQGSRLEDLTVQTATYGSIIPRVYGTVGITGNIFWVENNALKEVETRSQSEGKGGGGGSETSTFSYYATFAIGLCKGPIGGVRRVWVGANLIYDLSSAEFGAIIASNQASKLFTVHTGSNTQAPDDRMQATLGVANTPAYRGLAYLVFKDLPLKDYGNSLAGAQIKVEVVNTISSGYTSTIKANPVVHGWGCGSWNGKVLVYLSNGGTQTIRSYDGSKWYEGTIGSGNWGAIANNGNIFCAVSRTGSAGNVGVSNDGVNWQMGPMPSSASWESIAWNGKVFCALASSSGAVAISLDGLNWTAGTMPVAVNWSAVAWNGLVFCAVASGSTYTARSIDGLNWTLGGSLPWEYWTNLAWNGKVFCAVVSGGGASCATSTNGLTWTLGSMPLATGWNSLIFNGKHFFAVGDAVAFQAGAYSADGLSWTSFAMPVTVSWGNLINMEGILFSTQRTATKEHMAIITPSAVGFSSAILGDIVLAESMMSKLLSASDIDVSEITKEIRGYRIASISAVKSSLIQLQGACPFDVVQSGYKMKFKPRGGASVVTIPASDLGAVGESI